MLEFSCSCLLEATLPSTRCLADPYPSTPLLPSRAGPPAGRHPSLPLRPLPGLSAVPPWASTAHAAHASGLASFSSLAQALPVFLPTGSSAELPRTASAVPSSPPTRLEADPALSELLKLKCSLRRAVQDYNSQAIGLILSLLGALPVTPELLAASQMAAVVEPLQQSSCTQVATAAR